VGLVPLRALGHDLNDQWVEPALLMVKVRCLSSLSFFVKYKRLYYFSSFSLLLSSGFAVDNNSSQGNIQLVIYQTYIP
jgi:hypothetical protein